MNYKLTIFSATKQTEELFFNTLEDVLKAKEQIKKTLDLKLNEALANHAKRKGCTDSSCQISKRLKHEHSVKFKVSIARWEDIG